MGQCDHKGPYKRKIRIRERFKDAILLQVSKIEEETMSERKRLWTLEMARKDPPLESSEGEWPPLHFAFSLRDFRIIRE